MRQSLLKLGGLGFTRSNDTGVAYAIPSSTFTRVRSLDLPYIALGGVVVEP